jgi:hypothetical protein
MMCQGNFPGRWLHFFVENDNRRTIVLDKKITRIAHMHPLCVCLSMSLPNVTKTVDRELKKKVKELKQANLSRVAGMAIGEQARRGRKWRLLSNRTLIAGFAIYCNGTVILPHAPGSFKYCPHCKVMSLPSYVGTRDEIEMGLLEIIENQNYSYYCAIASRQLNFGS